MREGPANPPHDGASRAPNRPDWRTARQSAAGVHRLTPGDAVASLQSSAAGLTRSEAARRLQVFGRNGVDAAPRAPAWWRLAGEFGSFFSLILWLAAGLAFFAAGRSPDAETAHVGVAIVVVIVVSGLFSFWQESRVERTLAALRAMLPRQSQVVRDGRVALIDAEALVPGDIVLLAAGDTVPADCRLIEAFEVRVSNAALTGEAMPLQRDATASQAAEQENSHNIVRAGTAMVSGRAKAVVFATGACTEFGRIARMAQSADTETSPLRRQITHLARVTALLAVAIGLAFFAIGWSIGIPSPKALVFAIGIIVAMVPEGLLPTLTLALALATQRMARRGVLIRYLPAVEALGSTTVICTDKTGTLTLGRMTVRQMLLGDQVVTPDALKRLPVRLAHFDPFFAAARMCHDLTEPPGPDRRALRGDAMEVALVEMALQLRPGLAALPRLDELPFEAERMRLSTLHQGAQGSVLYCKGAPESVLPLCRRRLTGAAEVALDADGLASIQRAQETMAARGLRLLALAYRPVAEGTPRARLEEDLVFAGLVGLEDPPRPEVAPALRTCRQAGIKVIMVTGDHPQTALAIARDIALVDADLATVVTGAQLRMLSDSALERMLDTPQLLFARMAAEQKLRIVQALKRKGEIVAVTGDGVNDAPALNSAHIGIAMGLSGTDVAKEAADMVLLDDNFASIVNAVEEGRAVFDNVRRFLTYVLVHNVAELVPCLAFVLFRIPLALTAIQVLAIDMVSDALPALGLGVERPDPRLMQRPPRAPDERLLNLPLALRAYGFLGLIEAGAAMAAFFFVLTSAGWIDGQALATDDPVYRQATTATLSTIIVMQIVNVFLCRSGTRSVLATGVSGNTLILWGVATEAALLLTINFTPWGRQLLATEALDARVWAFMLPFAVGMLALEEGRKAWVRAKLPPRRASAVS